MTVQELINLLNDYPSSAQIYIGHYSPECMGGPETIFSYPIRGITNEINIHKDVVTLCEHPINGINVIAGYA